MNMIFLSKRIMIKQLIKICVIAAVLPLNVHAAEINKVEAPNFP